MVKEVMTLGDVKGILLPKGKKQQTIFQYVDDTTLSIKG
jgi:hypothetical protein